MSYNTAADVIPPRPRRTVKTAKVAPLKLGKVRKTNGRKRRISRVHK